MRRKISAMFFTLIAGVVAVVLVPSAAQASSSVDTVYSPNGKVKTVTRIVTVDGQSNIDVTVNTVKGKVAKKALVADRTVLEVTTRSDDGNPVTKRYRWYNHRFSVFSPEQLRGLYSSDTVVATAFSYEDGKLVGRVEIPIDLATAS